MDLPSTIADSFCPVADAMLCAATIASKDVRFKTPSRCSMKRSIPWLISPPNPILDFRFWIWIKEHAIVIPPGARQSKIENPKIENLDHSCVEAQFFNKLRCGLGGLAFDEFGAVCFLPQIRPLHSVDLVSNLC